MKHENQFTCGMTNGNYCNGHGAAANGSNTHHHSFDGGGASWEGAGSDSPSGGFGSQTAKAFQKEWNLNLAVHLRQLVDALLGYGRAECGRLVNESEQTIAAMRKTVQLGFFAWILATSLAVFIGCFAALALGQILPAGSTVRSVVIGAVAAALVLAKLCEWCARSARQTYQSAASLLCSVFEERAGCSVPSDSSNTGMRQSWQSETGDV